MGQFTSLLERSTRLLRGEQRPRDGARPHMIYLAIGFPPAAKSCAYRMRETANQFCAQGWDVTVVTLFERAWELEYGLDHTLSVAVDPRVRVVELPLLRTDLETNIRTFSEARSVHPQRWAAEHDKHGKELFPEPKFGGWRPVLEQALVDLHREHPADLLVTSCAPYVNLAATWRLWQEARVPYVIDFRDGWSVDVIGGGEAFTKDSVAGRWEAKVLAEAVAIWCVNDPIARFYRDRYPELADRVAVVRNGFDGDSVPARARRPDPEAGLAFGYLGSVNFKAHVLADVLEAWRIARRTDPLLARSTFEVRGHIGAGYAREDNDQVELLRVAAADGVTFAGPVAKAEVAATYGRWDVLVLILVGGRFVTSGKVYEFLSSGLPVMSAHDVDHDASTVLQGSPLWTGAVGLDQDRLAESFRAAARLAVSATDADRAEARRLGTRFARTAQLVEPVRQLTELTAARRAATHPAGAASGKRNA
jgi:glycosyltransferase involved in cell wall biosynthesis